MDNVGVKPLSMRDKKFWRNLCKAERTELMMLQTSKSSTGCGRYERLVAKGRGELPKTANVWRFIMNDDTQRDVAKELDTPSEHLFLFCCCGPEHCWFCGQPELGHMTD